MLNLNFWGEMETAPLYNTKYFIEEGSLWMFALVSHLNCPRSITGYASHSRTLN